MSFICPEETPFREKNLKNMFCSSSDSLSNLLLVLLLRILNSGISDSGLLAHLSEATAGLLNGVGHSTAKLNTTPTPPIPELFNATKEQNDYEISWSLRDIIADEQESRFYFGREIVQLPGCV